MKNCLNGFFVSICFTLLICSTSVAASPQDDSGRQTAPAGPAEKATAQGEVAEEPAMAVIPPLKKDAGAKQLDAPLKQEPEMAVIPPAK
ncbi:MAG: hypothetical protein HY885_00885 [Deltaproteobacteria bacterium]|nr:hypothetical protein [Deltaproteobacteria bacterium]